MDICTECNEQITNPICPKCIASSVEAWLVKNNDNFVGIIKSRLGIFDSTKDDINSELRCIKCNGPIDICMYCSSNEIYDWIKESKDLISIKSFPFRF